jgi:hypothetical protein
MMVIVAALEDSEFLCTVVSDTVTGTIIPPQVPLQIIYKHHHLSHSLRFVSFYTFYAINHLLDDCETRPFIA